MLKPVTILQASAGSGKTFNLTTYYLTLLLSAPHKYREILAVTFTNKATAEMKERILKVLEQLANGNAAAAHQQALILKQLPHLNPTTLQSEARAVYRKILHDYSRFSVSTIDKFVQRIIKSFAFEIGLNSNYALEMNIDKVKADLVERLEADLANKPHILDYVIRLALERIAGSKSWNYKTELLKLTGEIFKERFQDFEKAVEQIGHENIDEVFNHLIELSKLGIQNFEDSVKQYAQEASEFLKASAVPVEDLKNKSRSPLLYFHQISQGKLDAVDKIRKILDSPESYGKEAVIEQLYPQLNIKLKSLLDFYDAQYPEYQLHLSFHKNVFYLRLILELTSLLKAYKEESGTLLINETQKLLNALIEDLSGNPAFILEKMGQRYKHYLFDEFQDTSANQWNTFNALLTNALADSSSGRTEHLIVGDTKQAIYRWRNGDWKILHQQAKHQLGAHHIEESVLAHNYRSSANIIDFNNLVYEKLSQSLQVLLNEKVYAYNDEALALWWQEQGYAQIVCDIYATAPQSKHSGTLAGGSIKIDCIVDYDAASKKGETQPKRKALLQEDFQTQSLEKVIQEIHFLKNERNYSNKDICLLVRNNNEATKCVQTLMAANLDVISGEALMLANNRAIQLLINTLKVMVDSPANTALYKANCISLYAQIQGKLPEGRHFMDLALKTFSELSDVLPEALCQNWMQWLSLPLPQLIESLIEAYQLQGAKDNEEVNIHLPYLLSFRDIIAQANKQGEKGVLAFLHWWDEDGIKKTLPASDSTDAIQIITVHKAKGLDFRAVFIPFCSWDLDGRAEDIFWVDAAHTSYQILQYIPLPYGQALGRSAVKHAYIEELLFNHMDALNLLYVATTRCRDYLCIHTKGSSTENIKNVGDLFNQEFLELNTQNTRYEIDEFVAPLKKVETQNINLKTNDEPKNHSADGDLILKYYPTSNRLSEVFNDSLENPYIDLEVVHQRAILGNIFHEILAQSNDIASLELNLAFQVEEGFIKAQEQNYYFQQVNQILQHPQLQALYKEAKEIISEKAIINIDGEIKRPDKIFVLEGRTVVLDFKFTKQQMPEHEAQVLNYAHLLTNLGYKNVQAYIFYNHSQTLINLNL